MTLLWVWLVVAGHTLPPPTAYHVALFVGTAPTPAWQTQVPVASLTCQPASSMVFDPNPAPPATVADGIVVGWTSETTPTDYCRTPRLLPPEPGQYDVKVRSVTTTASGTVYGAWVTAIPGLTLQREPRAPCTVSGWSDFSDWSAWTALAGGGQARMRTRTRLVIGPATGGGAACPALTETERETQGVPDPATATFVRSDTKTQGTWTGVYGREGAVLVGVPAPTLKGATVTFVGEWPPYIWAQSTTDPRALQKPGTPTDRIAATWYSPTSFVLDVRFHDTQQHQVAVYVIDYDDLGRQQLVEVLDSMDAALLPAQTVNAYPSGLYFVWLVSGHVKLRLYNTTPALNAAASAVFLDPPSSVPINCSVSNWVDGVWGPWVAISATTEQRTMTRTRTVTTPASGGGTPCPALSEVVTETRPIATVTVTSTGVRQCLVTVSAPPPPSAEPGWVASWYVDSGLFAQDERAPYTGLVQVAIGSHAFQVRWMRPTARSWWRRLFRSVEGVVVYDPVTFVCQ